VWVAASLGCFGSALANGAEYTGDYNSGCIKNNNNINNNTTKTTLDGLVTFHQLKMEQALLHQPDAIAFETIPSLLECQAIAKLLLLTSDDETTTKTAVNKSAGGSGGGIACWVALACRNGEQLNDGTPVKTALHVLLNNLSRDRLQAIGFNCCDIAYLPSLVERLLKVMFVPDNDNNNNSKNNNSSGRRRAIVLYPNSGETWDADTLSWKPGTGCVGGGSSSSSSSSNEFVELLWQCVEKIRQKEAELKQPPVVIILGGCCRTTPATIAALRRRADDECYSRR
jgi:homocysteine S-methyltransferase